MRLSGRSARNPLPCSPLAREDQAEQRRGEQPDGALSGGSRPLSAHWTTGSTETHARSGVEVEHDLAVLTAHDGAVERFACSREWVDGVDLGLEEAGVREPRDLG